MLKAKINHTNIAARCAGDCKERTILGDLFKRLALAFWKFSELGIGARVPLREVE